MQYGAELGFSITPQCRLLQFSGTSTLEDLRLLDGRLEEAAAERKRAAAQNKRRFRTREGVVSVSNQARGSMREGV